MENRGEIPPELSEGAIQQPEAPSRRFFQRISEKWRSLTPEQRVYYTQLGLLFATQVVDVFTTYVGLNSSGGALEEKAVLARTLLDNGGFGALALLKESGAVGLAALAEGSRRMLKTEAGPWINLPLTMVNAYNTAISISNTAYMTGLL